MSVFVCGVSVGSLWGVCFCLFLSVACLLLVCGVSVGSLWGVCGVSVFVCFCLFLSVACLLLVCGVSVGSLLDLCFVSVYMQKTEENRGKYLQIYLQIEFRGGLGGRGGIPLYSNLLCN